ncbi:MAG: T9SS type A sorting domain-containing protein [Candidatus Marinimicrobia bacterium]|nr:T9SS type A sorting domain-containing protein [Candidatus Neomarinimicrobiota bacterium]MCF7850326.1 T9SS type A sorting domain-containing protein [Candidatus Neomarinimicrobiota bacterium]MCF7904526.1 T9SS type A sorting domain-containing protein [Candidatus Neomarinimicrobiota bacterium]
MKFLQAKGFQATLMLVLFAVLLPVLVLAASEVQSIETLKQLRETQNRQVMIENMKANSIQVGNPVEKVVETSFKKKLMDQKKRSIPMVSTSRAPKIHRIDPRLGQLNTADRLMGSPSPVMYGSGHLQDEPGLEYFNFYNMTNSADSAGMDVRWTGNESNNFGNEYANYADPSLLYFHADTSMHLSLDDISIVAPIDDPDTVWTDVSWDWDGGNNGGQMHVGEIWVVYTRTTHMYVVMEITGIDSTGESWPAVNGFTFDYKIQTDGTNLFGGSPPPPADSLEILVNGRLADTLLIGSEPTFSIDLGSFTEGELVVSWDANHNGETDEEDIPIETYDFQDNDENDLNPADSVFQFIYNSNMADGVNYIVDDFLYTVYAGEEMADASVRYYVEPTPYRVSGTVTDSLTDAPIGGIIVWGDYMWYDMGPAPEENDNPTIIAITDTLGQYTLTFPDSGMVMVGSWDYLMVTNGQVPVESEYELGLYSGLKNIDFLYRDPEAWIEGYVLDDMGMPLVDVRVVAAMAPDSFSYEDGGPKFEAYTDEAGFYSIGVDVGSYDIWVEPEDLVPMYMVPDPVYLPVTPAGPNSADITVRATNSTISGVVYLDDVPYGSARVFAWNWEYGWNTVMQDPSGSYVIPVYDPVVPTFRDTSFTGYDLFAEVDDEMFTLEVVQVSENWGVMPGTVGEDIMLVTLSGGLFGTFRDTQTNDPILDEWSVGMEARSLDNGMNFWVSPDPMDGSYELYLPAGLYEINAGGMDYYPTDPDTVLVTDYLVQYDILLDPIAYAGIFEGRVLNDVTSMPIGGADVEIGSDMYWDLTTTGPDGYFHFDLPNGSYHYRVSAMGYLDHYGDIDIHDNYQNHEIRLQELVINGAISGFVFDASPAADGVGSAINRVANAMVNVWNPSTATGFYMMTDSLGQFWFDLPNGIYDIYVEHPDFLPYWDNGLFVSNDTLYYDVPMMPAEGYISGRVFDGGNGQPLWDAQVAVIDRDSTRMFNFQSGVDDSGRFHIPVVNGTFDVFVDAPGYEWMHIPEVVVNFNDVWLEVPLVQKAFMGPVMHMVIDQPLDQGRWVRLAFGPEDNDFNRYVAYSIWRLTDTPMGTLYDFITYMPNRGEPFYNYVAPTLIDSNMYTTPEQYTSEFMVTGHYDDWNFVDGGHGFGWSIDNIQPGVPGGFVLSENGNGYNMLAWEPNTDVDFQYYELFRSESDDFSEAPLVAQVIETSYSDEDIVTDQEYFYMLRAIDANGNASEGAIVRSVVAVDGVGQIPEAYSLSQNYPNPFNPTTVIDFAIPEASEVSLEIYNIRGQKVRTLLNGHIPAGFYASSWNGLDDHGMGVASGTYIYLMKTADHTFSKKLVYMK